MTQRRLAVLSIVLLCGLSLSAPVSALPLPWGEVARVEVPDLAPDAVVQIALEGDLLAFGVPGLATVYLFEREAADPGAWTLSKQITAPPGSPSQFGHSLTTDGETLAVGAPGDGLSPGRVYVFERHLGGADNWGLAREISQVPSPAFDPLFSFLGESFGTSLDLDGDTLVVGALATSTGGVIGFLNSGRVFVFERDRGGPGTWGFTAEIASGDFVEAMRRFGSTLAIDGDTVVVGQPTTFDPGISAGTAFVFERNQGGPDAWGRVARLTSSGSGFWDQFGVSVDIEGDTAVVGAAASLGGDVLGKVYVFERGLGWGESAAVSSPEIGLGDHFGSAVDLDGDLLAVAAPQDDTGMEQGAVYLFQRGPDGWTQLARLFIPENPSYRFFGSSIALDGTLLAVSPLGRFEQSVRPLAVFFSPQPLAVAVPALDTLGLAALAILLAGVGLWRIKKKAAAAGAAPPGCCLE